MNIVFFRRPKPRPFNYKPLYYDADKEAAEERKRALGLGGESDPKERLRANIRRSWKVDQTASSGNRNAFIRIFFYAVIAFISIYFIFFTDFVMKFVSFFLR